MINTHKAEALQQPWRVSAEFVLCKQILLLSMAERSVVGREGDFCSYCTSLLNKVTSVAVSCILRAYRGRGVK